MAPLENPYESPRYATADWTLVPNAAPLTRPIRLSGMLSVADADDAFGLAGRTRMDRTVAWLAYGTAALVVFLFVIALLQGVQGKESLALIAIVVCGVITVFIMGVPYWLRTQARRRHNHGSGLFADTRIAVTEDTVETATEMVVTQMKWGAFRNYRHSDRVVLLFFRFPPISLILARANLENDGDWPILLNLLRRKLLEL
jgi:hypothetical protein